MGFAVGATVGVPEGDPEGDPEGAREGFSLGILVGISEGAADGASVGAGYTNDITFQTPGEVSNPVATQAFSHPPLFGNNLHGVRCELFFYQFLMGKGVKLTLAPGTRLLFLRHHSKPGRKKLILVDRTPFRSNTRRLRLAVLPRSRSCQMPVRHPK